MIRLLKFLVLIGLMFVPSLAAAQDGRVQRTERTERIAAELVPMSQWAAPGSTAIVAVRQAIEPGWHTYWRNPGDSGGPTTLTWTLPASAMAGDIVWPMPERQRLKTLMNFGYTGEVYLPVPVTIPADARGGPTANLDLSERRALAVADALTAAGWPSPVFNVVVAGESGSVTAEGAT